MSASILVIHLDAIEILDQTVMVGFQLGMRNMRSDLIRNYSWIANQKLLKFFGCKYFSCKK